MRRNLRTGHPLKSVSQPANSLKIEGPESGTTVAYLPHQPFLFFSASRPYSPHMLPSPHPAVIFKPVSEGAVLLHTSTEIYFGLNHVGAHIWQMLGETRDLSQMVARLTESYPDVPTDQLQADVEELVEELSENGLVVPEASNETVEPSS